VGEHAGANYTEVNVIRLLLALVVSLGALLYVQVSNAGKFLPHRKGLSVEAKVEYFKRSLRHERQVVAFLESRQAPRTLERVTEIRWYRAAVRWHERLLARYSAKLRPVYTTTGAICATFGRYHRTQALGWSHEWKSGG
jgi:hypothetical protein